MFEFFDKIWRDLYFAVHLALGGSTEDGLTLSERLLMGFESFIKIWILLVIIGVWYWFLVYLIKHSRRWFGATDKMVRVMRAIARYCACIACLLAVMTQIGIRPDITRGAGRAALWAGIFYVLWMTLAQILRWVLRPYALNESIIQLARNLLSVLLAVMAAAIVGAQFGFDVFSLVAGLGIAGLALGFAAQSTLANFIAGIAILVERSFQVGDWIRLGTQEGRVTLISLRSTQILDRDNIIIIIPNATVASSEVTNLTSKKLVRFDIQVRIGLDDDISQAREVISSTLSHNDNVLQTPAPMVQVLEIADFYVLLVARFWVTPDKVARIPVIQEQLREQVKNALNAIGISVPYPHLKLHQDTDAP